MANILCILRCCVRHRSAQKKRPAGSREHRRGSPGQTAGPRGPWRAPWNPQWMRAGAHRHPRGGHHPPGGCALWEVEGAWVGTGQRSSGPRLRSRAPPSSRAARAAGRPQAGIPRERGKGRWGALHCYIEAGSRKPTADDVSQESTLKIGNAQPSSSAFSFPAVRGTSCAEVGVGTSLPPAL